MLKTLFSILCVSVIVMGCSHQTSQKNEYQTYKDEKIGIAFDYPATWTLGENFFFTAVLTDALSQEKTMTVWEGEPISPKAHAQNEKEMLTEFITSGAPELPSKDASDNFAIDQKIIKINDTIAAIVKTNFADENAQRSLRFYKDDWQITIIKKLPVTQTGTTVTEIMENVRTATQQEAVQKMLQEFEKMIGTIEL